MAYQGASVGEAVSQWFSYYGQEPDQSYYEERREPFFSNSSLVDLQGAEEYSSQRRHRYVGMDIDDEILFIDGVPVAETMTTTTTTPSHAHQHHHHGNRRSTRAKPNLNYKSIAELPPFKREHARKLRR